MIGRGHLLEGKASLVETAEKPIVNYVFITLPDKPGLGATLNDEPTTERESVRTTGRGAELPGGLQIHARWSQRLPKSCTSGRLRHPPRPYQSSTLRMYRLSPRRSMARVVPPSGIRSRTATSSGSPSA